MLIGESACTTESVLCMNHRKVHTLLDGQRVSGRLAKEALATPLCIRLSVHLFIHRCHTVSTGGTTENTSVTLLLSVSFISGRGQLS